MAVAIHEQKCWAIRRLPDSRSQIVDALHRLAIDLENDVSRLDAGIGGAPIRIHVLHHDTAGITRKLGFRGKVRGERGNGNPKRCLVV